MIDYTNDYNTSVILLFTCESPTAVGLDRMVVTNHILWNLPATLHRHNDVTALLYIMTHHAHITDIKHTSSINPSTQTIQSNDSPTSQRTSTKNNQDASPHPVHHKSTIERNTNIGISANFGISTDSAERGEECSKHAEERAGDGSRETVRRSYGGGVC
jgi:hypothetical protein